jgi:hypothetical protein
MVAQDVRDEIGSIFMAAEFHEANSLKLLIYYLGN